MRKKRLTKAVQGLDPGSRALLDLSLRRRVPDDEIGDFLGIDAAVVARRRAAALRRLGNDLEIERPEELTRMLVALAALPADAWGVPARPGEVGPVELPADRTVEVGGDRRRRRAVVVAGVPLTALGVLVAMIIAAGGDETLMETGRVQGDYRPAPPVLGEVPTPLPDDRASGGDRRRSSGGGNGDSSDGPAVASAAVAPAEAAPPEPELEVKGRQEQGGSEDGERPSRPRERDAEPTPAPTPAPAPQAAPAPVPAPAPEPTGGGDDDNGPRTPTKSPANAPALPVPTIPDPPRPPKPPEDDGDDGGDDDGDDRGGPAPQPAPQQPTELQDGGGKKSWKKLKSKLNKGDRHKSSKRGRKRGDD